MGILITAFHGDKRRVYMRTNSYQRTRGQGQIFGCHRHVLSYTRPTFADIAQLVEQLIRNEQVRGSNPRVGSNTSKSQVSTWLFSFSPVPLFEEAL